MKKFLLISILLTPGVVFGKTISGTVVDGSREPVIGASVIPSGYNAQLVEGVNATITDLDGNFSISQFPDNVSTINVSSIGYKTESIPANDCTQDCTITLQEDKEMLEETLITGSNDDVCGKSGANAKYHAKKTKRFKNGSTESCNSENTGSCYCAPENKNSCLDGYKYNINSLGQAECVSIEGDDCFNENKHEIAGTWICDDDYCSCADIKCEAGYKLNDTGRGNNCIKIEKDCSTEQKAKIEHGKKFEQDSLQQCKVLECGCGYKPNAASTKCEKITETNCSADNAKTATYECENDKQICKITECNDKYELNAKSNKCVPIAGSCKPDDPNAQSGRYETDKNNQKICVIDSCKKYYEVKDGKCVLSNEHSAKELEKKSENVNKLREREQSLANRMTSAVSMGATGIGGMMLAQSLAEQNADKDAEQDMAAYLATFRCEYAGGKSVPGGTNGVQLPADKLFDLYQEYTSLSADLKERKEALGLKPGIESEVILDKANIGLYDDTSTGKTNGTYASVARALADPNSADAQKWNEQKEKTDKNLKIGTGLAIGGAVVGLAGNIIDKVTFDKTTLEEDETFQDAVYDQTGKCSENCPKNTQTNVDDIAAQSASTTQTLYNKLNPKK